MVFDEADRMLTLEMEDQLRKFVNECNLCPRQTLLFSATMPPSVQRLARSAVLDPITITVGDVGDLSHSVTHNVMFMHTWQKKVSQCVVILWC
jgi:ATP-dependent RNA helicase DDX42